MEKFYTLRNTTILFLQCLFFLLVTSTQAMRLDVDPPIAVCQDISVQLDASGTATIMASELDGGSTDDVGIDFFAVDIDTFTCADVGTVTVTLTVTDLEGFTDTCTSTVTVEDVLPSVLNCPENISIEAQSNECQVLVNYPIPTLSGDCGEVVTTFTTTFNYTGSIESFTVPAGVTMLNVAVYGAEGGGPVRSANGEPFNAFPGLGAQMIGDVFVTPGDVLQILVGEKGKTNTQSSTGGGGSFVIGPNGPLVIAAGGGGAWTEGGTDAVFSDGQDGLISTNGGGSSFVNGVNYAGGDNGNGGGNQGPNPIWGAGSGGGYLTDGASTGTGNGGLSFLNGGTGGDAGTAGGNFGGYGGGGSHTNNGCCSAGGGGGYSGGLGGGRVGFSGILAAGGGGSINTGINQNNVPGARSADGQVLISYSTTSLPVTQIAGLPSGSMFPVGTTTNTFEVTDSTGSVLTCSFDIVITDATSLSISCPGFQSESLNENCEFVLPDYTSLATTVDGCGMPPIITQTPAPGTIITTSNSQTIELSAAFENETLTCSFTMQATDNTPPEITFCTPNITVDSEPGLCGATVNFTEPTGTDLCGGVQIFSTTGFESGDFYPSGVTNMSYIILDDQGNSVFCDFTITVNDIEPPVVNCEPFTVSLDEMGAFTLQEEDAFPDINYTIDQTGAYAPIDISTTGTIINIGTFVTNLGAFPIGFTFNFYGNDFTEFYAASNGFITFNDNESDGCCSGQSLPANIDNLIAYFWTLLDPDEGGQLRYQTIGTAPNRTLVLSAEAISMFPILSGNNGITITSQVHLKEGSNVIEIHTTSVETLLRAATMGIQNADGTKTQSIPGRNGQIWSATNDFVSFTPPDPNLPTISDNCEIDNVTFSPATVDCTNIGDTEVIITVMDAAGNEVSCTTTVTVIPFCPEDIIVDNDVGMCGAVVVYPDIANGCPSTVVQTAGLASGSLFPIGETINTFTITSTSMPETVSECSFTVIVTDIEAPTIDCPENITVERDPGECTAIVTYTNPVGVDPNCPNAVTVQTAGLASGAAFPTGTTLNVFEVTDENGNTSTCSFEVTVNDIVGPTITCEEDIIIANEVGLCGAIVNYTMPVAMDDCVIASVTQISGLPSGSFFPQGVTINQFEVVDGSGNTAMCSFTVTVEDTELPAVSCGDPITVFLDQSGQYFLEEDDFFPTSNYNLDQTGTFAPIDISTTGTSFNLDDDDLEFGIAIGFPFEFYGNVHTTFTASSNGFITFDDNADDGCCRGESLPTNNIRDFIAYSWTDLDPEASGIFRYETIGVAPNRTLVFSAENVANFDDNNLKTNAQIHLKEGTNVIEIHTLSTEIGGDQATMGIQDFNGEAFVAVPGRDGSFWNIANDFVSFTPQVLSAMYSDNCGIDDIIFSPASFDCTMLGDQEVTITVLDSEGNMASCTTTVTVEAAVYANCTATTVMLDPVTGTATITPADIDNGSASSCGNPFTLSIDKDTFTCEQAGTNIVTLTITDDITGITDSCEAEVFVETSNSTTWNGSNWSNGVPDITTVAIINGTLTVTPENSFDACSCVVNSVLDIRANAYVNVAGNITNNSFMNVNHQGSVVQVNDLSETYNNGFIQVQLITPDLDPRDFMVLGSPMTEETRTGVFDAAFRVLNHTTANFIPDQTVADAFPLAENFADDNGDNWTNYDGTINPAEGYLVWPQPDLQTGGSYTMFYNQGTLNNGIIDFEAIFNSDKNSSPNIMSNPYPSAISAVDFINANPMVDEIYFWEHLTEPSTSLPGYSSANVSMQDISLYNLMGGIKAANDTSPGEDTKPNGIISTGQGFGIKASAAGTAIFNNSMRRVTGNNTLRAPENENKIWLNIKNVEWNIKASTLIGFTPNASEMLDSGYDSRRLATFLGFYSHLQDGTQELGIQSLGAFNSSMTIPIGFTSQLEEDEAVYTISISDVEGEEIGQATVYLVDNETGSITNLTESDYSFVSNMGTFHSRFMLQFENETTLGTSQLLSDGIKVYPVPAKNVLHINSIQGANISEVSIYDLQGRRLFTKVISVQNNHVSIDVSMLSSANYIMRIDTQNGSVIKNIMKE